MSIPPRIDPGSRAAAPGRDSHASRRTLHRSHGRDDAHSRRAQRAEARRHRGPPAAEWSGISGRVSEVFNEVVERNERMAHELERLSRIVGKEGKLGKRGIARRRDGLLARLDRRGQRADRRSRASDERNGPRHRRRRQGRPVADDGARSRRRAAARASSCARRRPSTRWSTSSARSPPK